MSQLRSGVGRPALLRLAHAGVNILANFTGTLLDMWRCSSN